MRRSRYVFVIAIFSSTCCLKGVGPSVLVDTTRIMNSSLKLSRPIDYSENLFYSLITTLLKEAIKDINISATC